MKAKSNRVRVAHAIMTVALFCLSVRPIAAEVYDEEFLFKKLRQLFSENRDKFKDKDLKNVVKEKNVKDMFTSRHFILAKAGEIWRVTGNPRCIQVSDNSLLLIEENVVASYILRGKNQGNEAQMKLFEKKEFPLDDICYVGKSVAYTTKGGDINHYVPLYSFNLHPQFIPTIVELCEIELADREARKAVAKKAGQAKRLEQAQKKLTRTFTSKDGKKKRVATALGIDDDEITLWIKPKNKIIKAKINKLSEQDAKWIKKEKIWIKKYGPKLEEELMAGNTD